jgi:hypothetical protein
MPDKTNAQRMVDIKAMLDTVTKRTDTISLDDCAALWGVTKPRFVNKRKEFAAFPAPVAVEKNAHLYPAKKALQSMLDYLERHHRAQVERVQRQARILGGNAASVEMLAHYSPAEIVQLNRAAADIAQREIEQGNYVPVAQVAAVAGEVFSEISGFMSNLSNLIDPHGRLTPEIRGLIDSKGHERLLALHRRMKDLLSDDVVRPGARAETAGSKRASPRRKREGSVRKPAR